VSSAANKKAALSKEVDDERAMAEALAANRAEENEKAFNDVVMQDAQAMLAGSPLATQEILLSGASEDFLEEAGVGDAATFDYKSTTVTVAVEQTFDYNSNNVTAAVQGNTEEYDPVPPRKLAFLAMVGNEDTTVKGATADRLTAS
jgi:hypothetical protein